jgi:parallel beta-helix repeat protein
LRRPLIVLVTVWFVAVSTLFFAFECRRVSAQTGVIYIRPGGDIEPTNAPITKQGNIYTLTGDLRYPEWFCVVVQCSNIVLDGGGYVIRGYETSYTAVKVYDPNYILEYITVRNTDISNFNYGIHFLNCTHCSVQHNLLAGNDKGIELENTDLSVVEDNTLMNNTIGGIDLYYSDSNDVKWNNSTERGGGIGISEGYENEVYWNHCANGDGIGISAGENNTIFENTLENNYDGIVLQNAYTIKNSVYENSISGNEYGIHIHSAKFNNIFSNSITASTVCGVNFLHSADNNTLSGNAITENQCGINFYASANNTITQNLVANNNVGINVTYSLDNVVHHNSFVDNTLQAIIDLGSSDQVWDEGYPSGGNYWSNYVGVDYYNGSSQDILGSDGIGDKSLVVNGTTKWAPDEDRYQLVTSIIYETGQTHRLNVLWNGDTYYVDIESNSTLVEAEFRQSDRTISLDVAGLAGTTGFCNITIPRILLEGNPYTILIDGVAPVPEPIVTFNDTHAFICFTYSHSTRGITITGTTTVPEFPTLILPPILVALALLLVFTRDKTRKTEHEKQLHQG